MIAKKCPHCGGNQFKTVSGKTYCLFCDTELVSDSSSPRKAVIDLKDDINRLLDKCKKDPRNARKYANLILDIDPGNREAWKYL